eukprot:4125-Heterococcus_DN1.PRE.2
MPFFAVQPRCALPPHSAAFRHVSAHPPSLQLEATALMFGVHYIKVNQNVQKHEPLCMSNATSIYEPIYTKRLHKESDKMNAFQCFPDICTVYDELKLAVKGTTKIVQKQSIRIYADMCLNGMTSVYENLYYNVILDVDKPSNEVVTKNEQIVLSRIHEPVCLIDMSSTYDKVYEEQATVKHDLDRCIKEHEDRACCLGMSCCSSHASTKADVSSVLDISGCATYGDSSSA